MSMQRSLVSAFFSRYSGQRSVHENGSHTLLGRVKPHRSDMIFLVSAAGLFLVFFIAGLVELINATSISKWLEDTWRLILGTSPSGVQHAINQPLTVQLPSTTIGDLLASLGRILLTPLDAILAVLILAAAIFVRVRSYIGRVISPERIKSFRVVSWLLLGASLIPSAVDGIW